jgi:hypothetical protein
MSYPMYVYVASQCVVFSPTVTRWQVREAAAGSMQTFRGVFWRPADVFVDLEMSTGAMNLVWDFSMDSLYSSGYLAVKSLIIGATKLYTNSTLGGNIIQLLFPWVPPTITYSDVRPFVHKWLSSVFPSIAHRLQLNTCRSRRCGSVTGGCCALQELQYLFLKNFESLHTMWQSLNMREIMTNDEGRISLISPTIGAIRVILYT